MTNTPADLLLQLGISLDPQQHSQADSETSLSEEANSNTIAVLSHYSLLRVAGNDARKFLQGQLSCNLDDIGLQSSSPGSYNTPQGRMISSFQIAQTDEQAYLLRMRGDIVQRSSERLAKYIVFSKAEQSIAEDIIVIGLDGIAAANNALALFRQLPGQRNGTVNRDGNTLLQLDDEGRRFECWLQCAQLATLWPQLSTGLTLRGSRRWLLSCIQHGLAEVEDASYEQFSPQAFNYTAIGAVSFKKGCYTGQEIIARMWYKGKIKRRLYRIQLQGDISALTAGSELLLANNKSAGTIINIEGDEALAVIASELLQQSNGELALEKAKITVLPLPYAITNEEQ